MKNKFLALLLIVTFALSGCGASNDASTSVSETPEATEQIASTELTDVDSIGDIEVDRNLFTVELTIPADYVGETTQEELSAIAEEKGYKSVILNEDGSATYTMTKSQHNEMMEEMRINIETSLNEMIGSEEFPSFTAIVANDDFTSFTITTTSQELDLTEAFSVIGFYMYGGMYNIFNGTPVDNVHVEFVNAETGEIISASDSSEMENIE